MRFVFFFASFAIAMNCVASRAEACSVLDCDDVFFPRAGFTVPANATSFVFYSGRSHGTAVLSLANVTSTRAIVAEFEHDSSLRTAVPIAVALHEGDAFAFRTNDPTCWEVEQLMQVGPATPLPTTLGTLTPVDAVHARVSVPTLRGYCADLVQAVAVNVDVALSEDARPWEGMLMYEVLVDGDTYFGLAGDFDEPPHGSTHRGFGTVQLSTICAPYIDAHDEHASTIEYDPSRGLAQGDHEVIFRATVAGTDTVVETHPITVSLNCLDLYTQEEIDAALREGGFSEDAPPASSSESGSCSAVDAGTPARSARWFWLGALLAGAAFVCARTRSQN